MIMSTTMIEMMKKLGLSDWFNLLSPTYLNKHFVGIRLKFNLFTVLVNERI